MSTKLKTVKLVNFKSIREQSFELESVNVLIGANGAGKSNLLSFFKLLNEMLGMRLQSHIEQAGGANSLLHYGSKRSPSLEAELTFETDTGLSKYVVRLVYAAVDRLIFSEERIHFLREGLMVPYEEIVEGGHRETRLTSLADQPSDVGKSNPARVIRRILSTCRVYQFHDTSLSSAMRNPVYVDKNRPLMPDGGNLAAFLHGLRRDAPTSYSRIRRTIQQIAPFFDDFDLDPTSVGGNNVRLNWRERDSNELFGPHQLSDGTLRAIALITLLLQPNESLPTLLVLDEPELGLHPAAVNVVAALMKQASLHCQILIATQSTALLDEFEPSQVIVVERDDATKASTFERLDPASYAEWLEKYSLHELWERNVIGGGPF